MKFTGPTVKLSRQLGIPLTPKAVKYMERRPYAPGEHGQKQRRSRKFSDYKLQLLEKQRLRFQYNVHERQLRTYARKAIRSAGKASDNLIQALERRLDAVVLRSGLARTMAAARQAVNHGHILVNGNRVNIPSFALAVGDEVAVRPSSRSIPAFVEALEEMPARPAPAYLDRSGDALRSRLLALPLREQVPVSCEFSKVIEYYAR